MSTRKMHGTWSSRWVFILAATGSAVGLGNIWKFPYITGENGGGAFVLIYLIFIVAIGIPIMIAEVMIGRRGRHSPVNTMREMALEAGASKAWTALGGCGVVAGLLILSFYSVIAGQVFYYIFATAEGTFNNAVGETVVAHHETLEANPNELIKWHSMFLILTMAVVMGGVTKGLGNAVKILMPILCLLLLILLGYSIAEGDFGAGFSYLFNFKFDNLSWDGVVEALGHACFTLSIGMGAIMAYGAYMPRDAPIGKTVITVGALDTIIALVAGLAIFPIVFASDAIQPDAGPSLLFKTLPVAFGNMPGGTFFGTTFFILVGVAAWSSAISLIEPGVAWLVETRKFNRVTANLLLGAIAWTIGLGTVWSTNDWENVRFFIQGPDGFEIFATGSRWEELTALAAQTGFEVSSMDFFTLVDFISGKVMLPIGGALVAVFATWIMKKNHVRNEMSHETADMFELWHVCARFLAPIVVAFVMIYFIWDTFAG